MVEDADVINQTVNIVQGLVMISVPNTAEDLGVMNPIVERVQYITPISVKDTAVDRDVKILDVKQVL